MIHTRYREDKATQAAARMLRLRGGRMSHLKLIKLLYLLDREAFIRLGRPVTHDSYSSMPHGPVPSFTLDRINEPEESVGSYWDAHIAPKQNHEVSLRNARANLPHDQLSRAEEELIDEVFAKYGRMTRWQLRDFTHTLPEWEDPRGSSRPIDPATFLRHAGYSDEDIAELEGELNDLALADHLF
jgi:uncharacterized phage-associated protein